MVKHKSVSPDALYKAGRSAFERGEFAEAEKNAIAGYQLSRSTSPEWAWRFRVLRAEVLVWRGMSKDALALISEDPPVGLSDATVVRRKVVLGLADCFLQRFDEADRLLAEAQSLSSAHEPSLSGDVFLAQGVAAVVRSNYSSARQSFLQALQIGRQQNHLLLQASALGNLGTVSSRTQHYDEAIDWFRASLKISEALGNRPSIAKVMGSLGWCYRMLGDSGRASDLLEQAAKLSAEQGMVKDQQVWVSNIGRIYYSQRNYEAANEKFTESLAIARQLQNKTLEATALNQMTDLAIAKKEFDRAVEYNEQAMELSGITKDRTYALDSVLQKAVIAQKTGKMPDAERLLRQVDAEATEDPSLRWKARATLAEVYAQQTLDTRADAQFLKALSDIDHARSSLSKEEYRLSFLNTATEFYNDYIDFLVSRGRIEDALAVAEHSRARTLAEGLGIKPSALGTIGTRPAEIARRQNAVILAYWLKPDHSYLWAITPTKVALFPLPADREIDSAVQSYRKALTGPRDPLETANSAGQQLYELLVAPAQKLISASSRVVVISDGSLHSLNFETLLVPGPKLHYWIEDVTISNANSLGVLGSRNVSATKNEKRNLLLIGNPLSVTADFPRLPQAAEEIRQVAAHFAADSEVVVDGSNATPAAYLGSDPGKFSYIHFVAHGTASRLSPLDSSVVLSPQGDAYKLYARDIVERPLKADLVTISACYGSGNRAYSGEGLVGLSWAFLRAGARDVVAALWEANDVSTPKLMDAMYAAITAGEDPASALRKAKLAMLHSDSVFRRPFYWAPFQLYEGFGRPTGAKVGHS